MDGAEQEGRAAAGFLLVLLAASCVVLGSSAVFHPSFARWATARVLGASLGFATGVMLYVSLVDIYSKSISAFEEHGHGKDVAFVFTTLAFFAGVAIMKMLNVFIKRFTESDEYEVEAGMMEDLVALNEMDEMDDSHQPQLHNKNNNMEKEKQQQQQQRQKHPFGEEIYFEAVAEHDEEGSMNESTFVPSSSSCSSPLPWAGNKNNNKLLGEFTTIPLGNSVHSTESSPPSSVAPLPPNIPPVREVMELVENGFVSSSPPTTRTEATVVEDMAGSTSQEGGPGDYNKEGQSPTHSQDGPHNSSRRPRNGLHDSSLYSMGATTAAAIALHNFPEGLVTFVAYMENPAVGIALAIGIAIHGIPEGLCVAMAVYQGTGSRWKGFAWGTFCCVSEPIGALLAWIILQNDIFSGDTYGIIFGVVAGMMVFICLDELLPMAFKFDPRGSIVTWSCLAGMFLVAASLMLFASI